ncbi:MAG: hypothetical protein ACKOEC_14910 [Acidimicrobiia bacterium]
MRTIAAIAIAPLAVVPVLAALFGPWAMSNGGMQSLAGIIGPGLAIAYPLLIVFGYPMHLALVRARCTRRRDYAIAGGLLGGVPIIGYVMVAVAFEAKFVLSAMGAALLRNLEWGAIGVLVFGLCGTAIAVVYRATVFPSGSR